MSLGMMMIGMSERKVDSTICIYIIYRKKHYKLEGSTRTHSHLHTNQRTEGSGFVSVFQSAFKQKRATPKVSNDLGC